MKDDMTILLWLASSLMISTVNSAVITYNAALNKTAYQASVFSNTYGRYAAYLANDGDLETSYQVGGVPKCSITGREINPWWAVDLDRPTAVYRVDLTNRGDGNDAYRSNNFIVGLTNVSPLQSTPTLWKYTVCGQYPGAVPAGATVSVYCQNNLPPSRYVIVQFPITEHMNFCELKVLVRVPDDLLLNVALNKPSFQVSTYVDSFGQHSASLANDGSRQTNFLVRENGCAASNPETDPWWAVDLGVRTVIYHVTLTNRGDAAGYRSNSFIVGLTNSRPGPHAHALWNYTLCGQHPGVVPDGATVTVHCTNIYERRLRFRYVIVQFPLINDRMNFCEVEVFALDEEQYPIDTTNEPPMTNADKTTTKLVTTTSCTSGSGETSRGHDVFSAANMALTAIVVVLAIVIVILVIVVILLLKKLAYAANKSVNATTVPAPYDRINAPEEQEYQEVEMSHR